MKLTINDPRRWWAFVAAVLLAAGAWTWLTRDVQSAGADRVASPREGFPAPDFTLDTLSGDSIALSSLRGKVVVVNLWASWCAPCRAEMPALQRLYDSNRDRGLVVLAVNSTIQDTEAAARAFADEMDLTFTVVLDRDGSVSRRYLLRALPSTFIVDRDGLIRSVVIGGPASDAPLQSKIEPLLAESP